MIFHDEDITRAYKEYVAEQGPDEEREPLLAIIETELSSVQATIEKSPQLKNRGVAAVCKHWQFRLDIARDVTNMLEGESIDEFVVRMKREADNRGYSGVRDMMIEPTQEDVVYWQLDVTRFVYVGHRRIGLVNDAGDVKPIIVHQESLRDLEEIVQGLRLLKTPFNGAVVE